MRHCSDAHLDLRVLRATGEVDAGASKSAGVSDWLAESKQCNSPHANQPRGPDLLQAHRQLRDTCEQHTYQAGQRQS